MTCHFHSSQRIVNSNIVIMLRPMRVASIVGAAVCVCVCVWRGSREKFNVGHRGKENRLASIDSHKVIIQTRRRLTSFATTTVFVTMLILVTLISLLFSPALAISAYWSPVLPTVCGASVPANITRALLACDRLMDKQLANIFEACVYNVHRMPRKHKLDKPKLCYYNKQALQLDRCKMLKYRAQAFSLEQLVEKEQDHTVSARDLASEK